jgi:hypothetical protein
MNGLTTIAKLPTTGGAGSQLKGETHKQPKPLIDFGITAEMQREAFKATLRAIKRGERELVFPVIDASLIAEV